MTKMDTSAFHARYGLRADGGWADLAAQDVSGMPNSQRQAWYELFDLFSTVRPRPPAATWREAQGAVEITCLCPTPALFPEVHPLAPGTDEYRAALTNTGPGEAWLEIVRSHLARIGHGASSERLAVWIRAATRSSVAWLNRPGPNREMLHAILWCVTQLDSHQCVDALRQLAAFATSHNTVQGTTIAIILAVIASEDALAALNLLAHGSKRPTTRGRFLCAADHVQRCLGLTADDAAERFVPTYGLDADGKRRIDLGAASAEIALIGLRANLRWFDAKRQLAKVLPVALKKSCATELATLKLDVKAIDSMILAQRDRLDRLIRTTRMWRYGQFRRTYLAHPLVGHLSRKLIWLAGATPMLFLGNEPRDIRGELACITDDTELRVWHPVARPVAEIEQWRHRLETLQLTQPFKQAHREVYILTDAERQTRTYSNRFASHILRQHQFAQLARARGWDYGLQGAWDNGDRAVATCRTPIGGFRVEFWVTANKLGDHAPSGTLSFISTDQIRFYAEGKREPLALDQIPPLVFSEVMRDVDLFVGVASVGNDPTWQDGGPEGRYRDYWQNYSFGELSETAKTRRAVLEGLLPRLSKIRERCSLEERFLIVRGDLRTYKIHLGSGNILMRPNDEYLCIVPDRSSKGAGDVYLPFEGDGTLAIILSKAFLLAEDTKIKDPTITRQISGK